MPHDRSGTSRPIPIAGVSASNRRPDQIRGGNHGLTPEQVVSSQNERVMTAMRELVASRGYRAVPVSEVIRHAGVSRKTFYELYAGKEECFVAVYEAEMERLLAPALQAFEGGEPWTDRLRTALGVLLSAVAADGDAARICFVEVLTAGPLALAARNTTLTRLDRLLTPPDAGPSRALTAGGVGYLSEVLHREVSGGRGAELPALRAELMRTLTLPFTAVAADVAFSAESASESSFLASYGQVAADMLGRVSAAVATDDDPTERVRAGVGALLEFCAQQPERARACLVEALSVGPTARKRQDETRRRLSELFEEPLRELRPSDRIARVSAIALVGGFRELVYDAVDRMAPADLPTIDTIVAAARLDPPS